MSHTKSHSPRSQTASMICVQSLRITGSLSRTRFGVKPAYTRRRRRVWSGSSIEIIIGSPWPCGRGLNLLENVFGSFSILSTSAWRVTPQTSRRSS